MPLWDNLPPSRSLSVPEPPNLINNTIQPTTTDNNASVSHRRDTSRQLRSCPNSSTYLPHLDQTIQSRRSSVFDPESDWSWFSAPRKDSVVSSSVSEPIQYQQQHQHGSKRNSVVSISSHLAPSDNPRINDRRLSIKYDKLPEKTPIFRKMSSLVAEPHGAVSLDELPITFQAKYLGHHPARGLWGMKHTRMPVDSMVQKAKNLPPDIILPFVKMTISAKGIELNEHVLDTKHNNNNTTHRRFFEIETISYGVQDLVYTRVFSMIVVQENSVEAATATPFECHAFVCDSRNAARRLTYALAAAFQEYSKRAAADVEQVSAKAGDNVSIADPQRATTTTTMLKKKFAIDLRSPEEIQEELDAETEA